MTRVIGLLCVMLVVACQKPTPTSFTTGGGEVPAEKGRTYRLSFDDDATGAAPADLINVLGDWKVEHDASAPSTPGVLRQVGRVKRPDFPRLVLKDLIFTDVIVRVRCRPESGKVDQACGLMFRMRDSDNYYVTRANSLEGNVRLYRVVDGDRTEFASAEIVVAAGQWHTLEATARGQTLTVSWNGRPVITATDATFAKGKVGLWTKADSVTAFDDLEVTGE